MIPKTGFCIELTRLRQERRAGEPDRTVSDYRCYWEGAVIPGLAGQMIECRGPGDNTYIVGNALDRRIQEGIYPLAIHHSSKYSTLNYSEGAKVADKPKPAIKLGKTKERQGILIHPAEGWKWSTGCLNPAGNIKNASSNIDYRDSREKVLAIINFLRGKVVMINGKPKIPEAVIWIKGEPI